MFKIRFQIPEGRQHRSQMIVEMCVSSLTSNSGPDCFCYYADAIVA